MDDYFTPLEPVSADGIDDAETRRLCDRLNARIAAVLADRDALKRDRAAHGDRHCAAGGAMDDAGKALLAREIELLRSELGLRGVMQSFGKLRIGELDAAQSAAHAVCQRARSIVRRKLSELYACHVMKHDCAAVRQAADVLVELHPIVLAADAMRNRLAELHAAAGLDDANAQAVAAVKARLAVIARIIADGG